MGVWEGQADFGGLDVCERMNEFLYCGLYSGRDLVLVQFFQKIIDSGEFFLPAPLAQVAYKPGSSWVAIPMPFQDNWLDATES